ncbi:unnamed protein product [Blepharisma stoltei]|uniref:Uncharacterized protein n=1 Tax=Blepharisma stoltei TaxID=1481888 RepID=A0AAU9JWV0_9CILI|nr:unnamed protein product [Blepharisma stoltei]
MKSMINNSLHALQLTREKILKERESTSETQATQGPLRSIPTQGTELSESEDEGDNSSRLKDKSISAGVQYQRGGLGVRTQVDLNQLRQEIKLRESEQFEREREIKNILGSDTSQDEQGSGGEEQENRMNEEIRNKVENIIILDQSDIKCCCSRTCNLL